MGTMADPREYLARSGSEVSQRLGTLERQMGAITQTLARIEASSFAPRPHGKDIASASHSQFHVSDSPVAVSDDSPVGFRGPNLLLASRESLLRKIDLPVFEGHMPYGWLCRVERYFRVGQYTEAEKLELISLSLEGRVLNWFEGEMVDNPFTDWSQFKERMLARFAVSLDDVPVFNGRMPYGWICRMQRFFRQSQYAEEQKLGLVPLCLEGDALKWYEEELGKAAFMNWLNCQKRLLAHFAPDESNVHSEVMLTTEMVPAVIAETELVQKVESPVVEALHEKSGAGVTCCINNVASSGDKYLLPSMLANVIDFGAEVELSPHGTGISTPAHEYQLCAIMSLHHARLRMRTKKQKWSKAWRFKFKQRRHHNNMSRPALKLADGRNNKSSYYHFGFNVALENKRQLLDSERNEFDIVQNELKHATEVFESVQDLPSAPNSTNDPVGIHDAAVVAHSTHRSDLEHTYAEHVLWSVQMTKSILHIQPLCLTILNALRVDWLRTTEKPFKCTKGASAFTRALQPGFECVTWKHRAQHVLHNWFIRRHKLHQRRKKRLSPKSWMFKYKKKHMKLQVQAHGFDIHGRGHKQQHRRRKISPTSWLFLHKSAKVSMKRRLQRWLSYKKRKKKHSAVGLFVFPVQSRVTGAKNSYQWMALAQRNYL